jgi:hypothetical protein
MQGNPTQRLQHALAEARFIVGGARPAAAKDALRQELASIARAVEDVMAIWDQMDKGNFDLQSVDANFYSAGETYLDAVELLNEALTKASPGKLDEVEQMLARAGRQLVTANDKAHSELERLQAEEPSNS